MSFGFGGNSSKSNWVVPRGSYDPYNLMGQGLSPAESAIVQPLAQTLASTPAAPTTSYTPSSVDSERINLSSDFGPYAMESTFTGTDIKALVVTKADAESELYVKTIEDIGKAMSSAAASTTAAFVGDTDGLASATSSAIDQAAKSINVPCMPIVNLTSVTVSTYRAKQQVRALGCVNPRGIARGSRTIAGTMIVTELDREAFWKILTKPVPTSEALAGNAMDAVLVDQVAPFNLVLIFANEYGKAAYRYLYDVDIVSNGVVYSVHDMFSEGTLSFMASDLTPLTPIAGMTSASHPKVNLLSQVNSASELLSRMNSTRATYDPFK